MGKFPEVSEVEHRLKTSSQIFCEWDVENFKGSIIKERRKGRLYTECFFHAYTGDVTEYNNNLFVVCFIPIIYLTLHVKHPLLLSLFH